MKGLLIGIVLLILVGIGGFLYRNAVSSQPAPTGACTADAKICPDGSAVGRVAPDCNFAPCPAPNVTIDSAGITFDLPAGFASTTPPDTDSLAAFALEGVNASTTPADEIVVKGYAIPSGEAATDVMHATAISDESGTPVAPSAFSATTLGDYTYTMVVLGRFNETIHVAYYLPRANDVLRFDAIDQNVADWSDPNLSLLTLPTNVALRSMLTTMQTNQ